MRYILRVSQRAVLEFATVCNERCIGTDVLGKQTGIAKFGCFIMPLRQVYWSWQKQANSRTALKNALTQFFSLILCYGAMVLMENWTPCMAKLEKLALHSVLRWTSTNKKVTIHGPLQHKCLFPTGSKSPLKNHIDPWFWTPRMLCSQFGHQLASCNRIEKTDIDNTL